MVLNNKILHNNSWKVLGLQKKKSRLKIEAPLKQWHWTWHAFLSLFQSNFEKVTMFEWNLWGLYGKSSYNLFLLKATDRLSWLYFDICLTKSKFPYLNGIESSLSNILLRRSLHICCQERLSWLACPLLFVAPLLALLVPGGLLPSGSSRLLSLWSGDK